MSELQKLLGSKYQWVQQRAHDAEQIHIAVVANQLTKEQAVELLQNLIDTDALDNIATDFTVKTNLINAIKNIITVVKALSSI